MFEYRQFAFLSGGNEVIDTDPNVITKTPVPFKRFIVDVYNCGWRIDNIDDFSLTLRRRKKIFGIF